MSGITFLSENYVDTATLSLTTGTENAQFPLDNIKNDSPSVKFRSIGSTAVVVIDLGATRDIDYVAVAADPIESFLITSASVKTSLTSDFSLSTAYPITLSLAQAIGHRSIPAVTHRFIELTLVGSGGFAEIGKVFVGEAINLPLNGFSISSFKYEVKDRSKVQENSYGQKFIDVTNQIKELGGTIEYCTKAEQEELDDMMLRHGQSYPLWVVLDPDSDALNSGVHKLTMYGYLENDISWSANGGQLYSVRVNMRQAI